MNEEIKFLLKVIRNGGILAGLYFVSVWASGTLSWLFIKPTIIFLVTYILTELCNRYKLNPKASNKTLTTLVL